jgi:hypothetical protein
MHEIRRAIRAHSPIAYRAAALLPLLLLILAACGPGGGEGGKGTY